MSPSARSFDTTPPANVPSGSVRTFSNVPLTPGVKGYNIVDGDDVLGGVVLGLGISIDWQDGPAGALRDKLNGAFCEDLIVAIIERLKCYQDTKYATEANDKAIASLQIALHHLRERMQDRQETGKLGENKV